MQTVSPLYELIKPTLRSAKTRHYQKGQTLIYPDDPIHYAYVIKKGAIIMYDIDDNGNQRIVHIYGESSSFPTVMPTDSNHSMNIWFYSALIATEAYVVPYKDFTTYICDHDIAVTAAMLREALTDMHELLIRIRTLSHNSSMKKLIGVLNYLAAKHGRLVDNTQWRHICFPVSHQLLAEMTGLTRETITHNVAPLQAQGGIRYARGSSLTIHCGKLLRIEKASSR